MFESKSESIATCLQTAPRTLPMYRSFGIVATDDAIKSNIKTSLTEQLALYYPDVTSVVISENSEIGSGEFIYNVTIKG